VALGFKKGWQWEFDPVLQSSPKLHKLHVELILDDHCFENAIYSRGCGDIHAQTQQSVLKFLTKAGQSAVRLWGNSHNQPSSQAAKQPSSQTAEQLSKIH